MRDRDIVAAFASFAILSWVAAGPTGALLALFGAAFAGPLGGIIAITLAAIWSHFA